MYRTGLSASQTSPEVIDGAPWSSLACGRWPTASVAVTVAHCSTVQKCVCQRAIVTNQNTLRNSRSAFRAFSCVTPPAPSAKLPELLDTSHHGPAAATRTRYSSTTASMGRTV